MKKIRGVDVRNDQGASNMIGDQIEAMAREILAGLSRRFTKPSEQQLLFCAMCAAVGGLLGIVEDQNPELDPQDIPEIVAPYVLLGASRTLTDRGRSGVFFAAAEKAMSELAKRTDNVEMTAAEFKAADAFHGLEFTGKPN